MKPLFYLIVIGLLAAAVAIPSPAVIRHAPLYSPNRFEVYSVIGTRTNLLAQFQAGNDPVKNFARYNRANQFAGTVPPAIRRVKFTGTWLMALDYSGPTFEITADVINKPPKGMRDPGPQTNLVRPEMLKHLR